MSSPLINIFVFTLGFLVLLHSLETASIPNNDLSFDKIFEDDFDETSLPLKRRSFSNSDVPEGYVGVMLGKRRLDSRAIRLPNEPILIGKRRVPTEALLLGKRDLPNEGIILGKRDLLNEAVLLGKRR